MRYTSIFVIDTYPFYLFIHRSMIYKYHQSLFVSFPINHNGWWCCI